jgi:hypothetical protein
LDIDGVLNAFDHAHGRRPWLRPVEDAPEPYRINHARKVTLPAEMCHKMGYLPGKSFTITWSDDLMGDIKAVVDDGLASIVWLTSWNEFSDFLGWKCFWRGLPSPAVGYMDCMLGGRQSAYTGKLISLIEICAAMEKAHPDGDVPAVISLDDDSPWMYSSWASDDATGSLAPFFHGIATDPSYGITKSQWKNVLSLIQ